MSGVCPTTPERDRNTYDDTPPIKDQVNLPVPDAAFNVCEGAVHTETEIAPRPDGEVIETETCCPSPGPPGPQGPCGIGFEWQDLWADATSYVTANSPVTCNSDVVHYGGETFVCILDHTSSTDSQPGVGPSWALYWQLFVSGGGGVVWRGLWDGNGIDYIENEFITHEYSSYMCVADHTSDEENPPDPDFDYEGGANWILVARGDGTGGLTVEDQGLFDSLFDGVMDWIGDIENWGLEDWLLLLAAGVGLAIVGAELIDMFDDDGVGDGEADSTYDGDPLYTGAFTAPTLQEVLSKICDWADVTDYDVSGIPATTLVNFTIGDFSSARSILEMLSQVYFFDMVDSGGILKFIYRGDQTSVATLTKYEDLGFSSGGGLPPAPINVKRHQGVDLPREVALTYFSEATAHQEFVQTANLETFVDGQDVKISIPITLTEQEAYDMAEAIIINSHIERMTYSFTTTYKNLALEPGDVVNVEDVGDVRIIQMEEKEEAGLIDIVASDASFNIETYTASGLPAETPITYIDAPVQIGYSAGLITELPPLDASDTEQRLSIAPHGYGAAGWPGCNIYYSIDDGVSYIQFSTVSDEATWGKVASPVSSISDWYSWDESTSISVELKTGTLSSQNKLEVLNGVNWCVIGEEVIGFRNAAFVSGTTYTLSGLIRGRRGTEDFISTHVADEAFILLNSSLIEFAYPMDAKEKVYKFKFVTIGSDISKATAYDAQPDTKSLRPWKPANVTAELVTDDWNIAWVGRNQFDGEMVDSSTVPQPEKFGGFILEILDPGDVVKRTIVQQTTTYTYLSADQITDFGVNQTNLKIRVAQVSLDVGPGYLTNLSV